MRSSATAYGPSAHSAHSAPRFAAEVDVPCGRLALRGELDLETAPLLHDAIPLVLRMQTPGATLVLADVDFIDASGLGAIVGLRNLLRATGRTLAISHARPRIVKTFRCAGLGELLEAQAVD